MAIDKADQPTIGGIVSVLQLIAVLSIIGAFFGGALLNLSVAAEIVFMTSAVISAAILWAFAEIVQSLRNIEFNTRSKPQEELIQPEAILMKHAR